MKKIINLINGFCMALADSVPGVSGGTVAFLMGFYDRFINSLNDLISGSKEERKTAFFYLINLGIGWAAGFVLAVSILSNAFEAHIYAVSSLFIGFIIFAVPLVVSEEKESLKKHPVHSLFILAGIALVALITYFNPAGNGSGFNVENLGPAMYLYIFAAGAAAVSAMVLPGISGSTIILIMGLYMPVINGIRDLLHLDFHALPILIAFGLGIIAGAISVVKLLRMALEKHRAALVYSVIGMMIGSIYAIAMGPETLEVPQPHMELGSFSIIFFLIGGVIIWGMQIMKKLLEKKNISD